MIEPTDPSGRTMPGPSRILVAIGALALIGATAFGLWHLVVGGLIAGNPRAGTFGAALGLAAGLSLLVGVWLVRRRRSAPR
jgi:hypothetical protein